MKIENILAKLKVGLIQFDGKWQNLALLKLSAWHKKRGDEVIWIDLTGFEDIDRWYGSSIFMGGSGYDLDSKLPDDIEHLCPDYEQFQTKHSIGFTSRGCIRNCKFCIVRAKEGKMKEWADFNEFLRHTKVLLLDNNFLASPKWKEKLQFLIKNKIKVSFCQGLDIRLVDDENAKLLAKVKWYNPKFRERRLYFAFDDPRLEKVVRRGVEILNRNGIQSKYLMFYMLTNFNTTWEEDWKRFRILEELGVDPYVMIYDRDRAPRKKKDFARWINQRRYKKVSFEKYDRSK